MNKYLELHVVDKTPYTYVKLMVYLVKNCKRFS